MTVIAQDDHLTAGAWAACGENKLIDSPRITIVNNNNPPSQTVPE